MSCDQMETTINVLVVAITLAVAAIALLAALLVHHR